MQIAATLRALTDRPAEVASDAVFSDAVRALLLASKKVKDAAAQSQGQGQDDAETGGTGAAGNSVLPDEVETAFGDVGAALVNLADSDDCSRLKCALRLFCGLLPLAMALMRAYACPLPALCTLRRLSCWRPPRPASGPATRRWVLSL